MAGISMGLIKYIYHHSVKVLQIGLGVGLIAIATSVSLYATGWRSTAWSLGIGLVGYILILFVYAAFLKVVMNNDKEDNGYTNNN